MPALPFCSPQTQLVCISHMKYSFKFFSAYVSPSLFFSICVSSVSLSFCLSVCLPACLSCLSVCLSRSRFRPRFIFILFPFPRSLFLFSYFSISLSLFSLSSLSHYSKHVTFPNHLTPQVRTVKQRR